MIVSLNYSVQGETVYRCKLYYGGLSFPLVHEAGNT